MISVIPQKRTNGFRKDLLHGSQDSDDIVVVPRLGSILSICTTVRPSAF